MLDEFLIYLLYLFYGMTFFAMGVAITSRDTSASNLKIARYLWLFALFAYTHAFHEWFGLYQVLLSPTFSLEVRPLVDSLKLVLMFVSFSLLLLFGMNVIRIVFPVRYYKFCLIPLLFTLAWILFMVSSGGNWSPSFFQVVDIGIRNFIGFPAAIIAGLGFFLYSKTVRHVSTKGARNFIGAGLSLSCYGILEGLVPSGTNLPPMGMPVEFFRGFFAFVILYFIMNALHTFDIERKLLIEERLHRFSKSEKLHSLGKLAFGIAHEINNPLTNVSINVELLKNDLVSRGTLAVPEKRFEVIERNLDRATKIAQELLSFSSQNESDFQVTDLNDVIASTLSLLGSRRKAYQITKKLNDVPSISAIPWKLEEVFLNVIINAMEAMPEGGSVTITTNQKEDKVVAEVSDTGHGILPEYLDNVLDPFFTTKEVGKGTGLGLSICYAIMEMHGGNIELESRVGNGTTVSLIFPIGVKKDA